MLRFVNSLERLWHSLARNLPPNRSENPILGSWPLLMDAAEHEKPHLCEEKRNFEVWVSPCLQFLYAASLLSNLLLERLVPPFTVSDFTQRLPFLVALAQYRDWKAKRQDGQNLDLLGHPEHGIHLSEIFEPGPV